MSDMSSFYGGRQGNSIVIAKRFDGINIPQPKPGDTTIPVTYTRGYYAVDATGNYLITTNKNIDGLVPIGIQGGNGEFTESRTEFLIKRTTKNYLGKDNSGNAIPNFHMWQGQVNDGSAITGAAGKYFYPTKALGMVQFFAEGAKTSSEVNYGAYVIIDTILNMASPSDPDNGKVFRRGMNINALDGLAGAEYIGQIVGPKGEATELDISTYEEVAALPERREKTYNAVEHSIVPGSYTVGGARFYEDEIKYAYATIRDAFGNITGCKLGFKLPTLVQDFEANSISPYTNRVKDTKGFDSKYTNLITEDEEQFKNERWKHPFYQKWQIKIPQGYHGANLSNVEVVPTMTMTPEYKATYVNGVAEPGEIKIYSDYACTKVYKTITKDSDVKSYPIFGARYEYIDGTKSDMPDYNKIAGKYFMPEAVEYSTDPSVKSAKIKIDGGTKYVLKEDCYMEILRYKEVDFDDVEYGKSRYYYIGDYDTIERVTLSDDGTLSVFYGAKTEPKALEQILRWIDTKNSDGITIDENGSIHIYYNTVHEAKGKAEDPYEKLDSRGRAHDHQDYMNVLDWITNVTLAANGKFTVLYNNNTVKVGETPSGDPIYGDRYETTLKWIDYIDFADDGTVTFRWNTDTERNGTPAYQFSNKIKYLKDVQVQNKRDENALEGTGDQRVHVKYNNDNDTDHAIGMPINYPIEYAIAKNKNEGYPRWTAPGNNKDAKNLNGHLLVYYSDPELRKTLGKYVSDTENAWVTYPSEKYLDAPVQDPASGKMVQKPHIWTEWIDLGDITGPAGGVHVLKEITNMNQLKDAEGRWIPPEALVDSRSQLILGDKAAGWACTIAILDYKASTAADSKALKIVADNVTPSAKEIKISKVREVNTSFAVGNYVREIKDSEYVFYDYEKKAWYQARYHMQNGGGIADPTSVVDKSVPIFNATQGWIPDRLNDGAKNLEINGWWFASERGVFAE